MAGLDSAAILNTNGKNTSGAYVIGQAGRGYGTGRCDLLVDTETDLGTVINDIITRGGYRDFRLMGGSYVCNTAPAAGTHITGVPSGASMSHDDIDENSYDASTVTQKEYQYLPAINFTLPGGDPSVNNVIGVAFRDVAVVYGAKWQDNGTFDLCGFKHCVLYGQDKFLLEYRNTVEDCYVYVMGIPLLLGSENRLAGNWLFCNVALDGPHNTVHGNRSAMDEVDIHLVGQENIVTENLLNQGSITEDSPGDNVIANNILYG